MSPFLLEAVSLSLLSFTGIVHIIYYDPASCCLLLLSSIIFWVSPLPAVKGSLQTPPPICLVIYWAHWLALILQNREWRRLQRTLTSPQPQEVPSPHNRFGVLIHKAMAQDRRLNPGTMDIQILSLLPLPVLLLSTHLGTFHLFAGFCLLCLVCDRYPEGKE